MKWLLLNPLCQGCTMPTNLHSLLKDEISPSPQTNGRGGGQPWQLNNHEDFSHSHTFWRFFNTRRQADNFLNPLGCRPCRKNSSLLPLCCVHGIYFKVDHHQWEIWHSQENKRRSIVEGDWVVSIQLSSETTGPKKQPELDGVWEMITAWFFIALIV